MALMKVKQFILNLSVKLSNVPALDYVLTCETCNFWAKSCQLFSPSVDILITCKFDSDANIRPTLDADTRAQYSPDLFTPRDKTCQTHSLQLGSGPQNGALYPQMGWKLQLHAVMGRDEQQRRVRSKEGDGQKKVCGICDASRYNNQIK